ncbi:MAG TPA: ADOP family duplicated permease [Acidobacteriota bacterium]|nr:ADOP family duplicated permease [Acidobacteriota bacterium]
MNKRSESRIAGVLLRLYMRLLLAFYPAAFRRRHGREWRHLTMLDLEELRGLRRPAYLAAVLVDALRGGFRLHLRRTARAQVRRVPATAAPSRGLTTMFYSLPQDFFYGLRGLRRRPGWTAAAVATLAIGLGATTVIFSAVNDVLLRPLPYPQAHQLVTLEVGEETAQPRANFSYPEFEAVRQALDGTLQVAAHIAYAETVYLPQGPRHVTGEMVSWQFAEVMGIEPFRGRQLLASDERPGAPGAALISHRFWQNDLKGRSDVLGTSLRFGSVDVQIVGILPPGTHFPQPSTDFWISLSHFPRQPNVHILRLMGRVRPDYSVAQAQQRLRNLPLVLPGGQGASGVKVHLNSLLSFLVGDFSRQLWLLMGAVGLVLLLTCLNVSNLVLAHTVGRRGEFALRSALGAGRGRLLRQVLVEAVQLAMAGGLGAAMLAYLADGLILNLIPVELPREQDLGVDATAFAACFGAAFLCGLLVGLLPALLASRGVSNVALRSAGARFGGDRFQHRLRAGLASLQVGLALVLLVGSGLLLKSFATLSSGQLGFEPRQVLAAIPILRSTSVSSPQQQRAFWAQLLPRLEADPKVEQAALIKYLPFLSGPEQPQYTSAPNASGSISQEPSPLAEAYLQVVGGPLFQTLGVPLLEGRDFLPSDRADSSKVAIVDESLARRLGGQAVGMQIPWGDDRAQTVRIVGVVGSVRQHGLQHPMRPTLYLPYAQEDELSGWGMALLMRVKGDPLDRLPDLRRQVKALAPDVPIPWVMPMAELISRNLAAPRFRTVLVGFFAATALLLAVIGVFAVLAHSVGARRRQIGIRMALGADRTRIRKWILNQALLLIVPGLLLGLAGSWSAVRLLESYLYRTAPHDPWTFLLATLTLTAAAFLSATLPAHRASRTNPLQALRCE